jgi:hypothetical protein
MSVAWVGAGVAAVGVVSSASSAGKAAEAQSSAADRANQTQMAQFEQTRADQKPFMDRGNAAGNRLQYMLGLDTNGGAGGNNTMPMTSAELIDTSSGQWKPNSQLYASDPNYRQAWDAFSAQHMAQYGVDPSNASGSNVDVALQQLQQGGFDLNAYNQANEGQRQQAQQKVGEDSAYGSLMRGFSAQDLNADPIYNQLAPGIQSSIQRSTEDVDQRRGFANSLLHQFGEADFQKDPGYDFRMKEGARGVENSAAARGMQLSGATLKAMTKYNQDFASNEYSKSSDRFNNDRAFASNEYGNSLTRLNTDRSFGADQMNSAYNRSTNDKTNQFNRLSGVAGTGQQSNALVAGLGANMAGQVAQNQIGVGNAQAASGIAASNGINNALTTGYGIYQNQQIINNRGASGAGGYTDEMARLNSQARYG